MDIVETVITEALENFSLVERLRNEAILNNHLVFVKALTTGSAQKIWEVVSDSGAFNSQFLNTNFAHVDQKHCASASNKSITKWLYKRGIPFNQEVLVLWDDSTAVQVPWKFVGAYHDLLFLPEDTAITIIIHSLDWGVVQFNTSSILFGYNDKPSIT